MSRIKIELPAEFRFTTEIPVRITDLNYGGHVGNDTILSLIHEARIQFLAHHGYISELNLEGTGLIMTDAAIEFKNELFYGETVLASITVGSFTKIGFEIYYKLEKSLAEKKSLVAVAKTGMLCFDYKKRKIVPVPEEVKRRMIG